MDLANTRYPRILDEFEKFFKKERNKTFKTYQFLSRKQREGEFEQFHSELNGLAARSNHCILERRLLRDVFIVKNRDGQTELCRSTITPDEVYKMRYRMKAETIMQKATKVQARS